MGGLLPPRGLGGERGVHRVEVCSQCVPVCAGARSSLSAASRARGGGGGGELGWKLGSSARR